MFNFIITNLKEIILHTLLILCAIYSVVFLFAKKFGEHTNIDDPLDDKFWKK